MSETLRGTKSYNPEAIALDMAAAQRRAFKMQQEDPRTAEREPDISGASLAPVIGMPYRAPRHDAN